MKMWWDKFVEKVGKSKILYFIVAFLIVSILGTLFGDITGLSVGLITILGKEAYNEFIKDGTGWDWKDVLAGLIGATGALIII